MPDPLAAARRDQSTHARLLAADKRDEVAHARDLIAITRDRAADARHLALVQTDGAAAQAEHAAEDRRDAAQDREQAARERLHALVDRELLAQALLLAAIDPLTGARARAAGLTEIDREHDRARRTGGLLVIAYIDVVGLKAVNDSQGHRAGDELLENAVAVIKSHLRSYDLVVRVGGDEFLCAMSNMTLPDAQRRFADIAGALAAAPRASRIRTGLAQLSADESAGELIARADGELLGSPHGRH